MERKILFIINPVSGRGKARKASDVIRKICSEKNVYCSIMETSGRGDATSIAVKGIEDGFHVITAVGGDGTVNEIGKILCGTSIALGIVPTGSGNGLARHLRIPLDLERAVRRIISGRIISMDTGLLNEKVFLNVAGIGFDARVSNAFARTVRRGWFNYLRIIISQSMNPSNIKVSIQGNHMAGDFEIMMMSFANSSQYGNNARIAPEAHVTDGKLDICILKPIGFIRAMTFLLKLLTGRLKSSSYFNTFRTTALTVRGGDGLAHIDGEVINVPDEFSIKIQAHSLKVIC